MPQASEHPLLQTLFRFLHSRAAEMAISRNTERVRRTGLRAFFNATRDFAPEVFAQEDPEVFRESIDRVEAEWLARHPEQRSTITTYASRTRTTLGEYVENRQVPTALTARWTREALGDPGRRREPAARIAEPTASDVREIPMGPGRPSFKFVAPRDFGLRDAQRVLMYLLSIAPDFDPAKPTSDQIFPAGGNSPGVLGT